MAPTEKQIAYLSVLARQLDERDAWDLFPGMSRSKAQKKATAADASTAIDQARRRLNRKQRQGTAPLGELDDGHLLMLLATPNEVGAGYTYSRRWVELADDTLKWVRARAVELSTIDWELAARIRREDYWKDGSYLAGGLRAALLATLERHEAEVREAERHEAEVREAERHEAEVREAERREAERRKAGMTRQEQKDIEKRAGQPLGWTKTEPTMEQLREAAELWLERVRPKLEAMSSPEVPPGYMAGFIARNEALVLDLMAQRLQRDPERLAKLNALLANVDELAWQLIDSIAEQVSKK